MLDDAICLMNFSTWLEDNQEICFKSTFCNKNKYKNFSTGSILMRHEKHKGDARHLDRWPVGKTPAWSMSQLNQCGDNVMDYTCICKYMQTICRQWLATTQ